jgi:hypothetical protein
MIFNDNDNIIRNKYCEYINRFRWCNRPETRSWFTLPENQGNKYVSITKCNRKHDKDDIEGLDDLVGHVEIIKIKGKENYMKSLNDNLGKIKKMK